MPTILTPQQLKLFFTGEKKHKCYKETCDLYDQLRMHANKEFPKVMIELRRPAESLDTKAYREKIYKSKTSNPIIRVYNSLSKIRRSQDWSIVFDDKKSPASIAQGETLEDYCERNYPGHDSVTNWVFTIMLKNQLIDVNAVVAVLPLSFQVQDNEYLKPVATIFNSDQVIYYEDGADFAILQSTDKSDIKDGAGNITFSQGRIFWVLTTTEVFRYEEIDNSGTFVLNKDYYYRHDKGQIASIQNARDLPKEQGQCYYPGEAVLNQW